MKKVATARADTLSREQIAQHRRFAIALRFLIGVAAVSSIATASAETLRGLTVAPEHRCTPYEKKRDYP